jgi:hypothetical protein
MSSNNCSKEWIDLLALMNESQRRWAAAIKALEIGYGGVSEVSQAANLSRTTITTGIKEITGGKLKSDVNRVRSVGAGRKSILLEDRLLKKHLEEILSETTAGDPMSRLVWTGKSVRKIAAQLNKMGHNLSFKTVDNILNDLDYSLQSNRKTLSRENNPNRDDQFKNINTTVKVFLRQHQPIISVDTKKKELVGKFKNAGKTWRKRGDPVKVEDHDFRSRAEGIAIPYGTYDLQRNEGFVNVGVTSDTAQFAVNSIKQWWQHFGRKHYPDATKILICADGGGSNGSSNRMWKLSLQNFSNEAGLEITVCHYPPGTSKWNKIEHRMFSYISLNWRGKPLENYETVVNLIAATTTEKGLKIRAKLDKRVYEKGLKVSDDEFDEIKIKFHAKYPKWNYIISPIK